MSSDRAGLGRRAVRLLRDVAQRACEALWTQGFRILGWARPSRAEPIVFAGGQAILVVAPHPDDEVAGCGGVIARHLAAGDRVTIAWITDGRRSTALGLSPDRTAAARRREAAAAAAALGVDETLWVGLREGEWRPADLVPRLQELLLDLQPAVVYAPSRIDFHPEHHAVAHALAAALQAIAATGGSLVVRVFQVQVPLGAHLVNRVADVSISSGVHDAALGCYTSQRGALARCVRMKRYAARAHRSGSRVEEFRDMRPGEYARIHLPAPETWNDRFRGLRYLALADPAAYLVGRAARRGLAANAPGGGRRPSFDWPPRRPW